MSGQQTTRISVEGIAIPGGSAGTRGGQNGRHHEYEVRQVAEFDLGAARGGATSSPEASLPPDSVLELTFEDGFRIFTVPEALARDFGKVDGTSLRSGGAGDTAASPAPTTVAIPRRLLPRRDLTGQRGVLGWMLRRLNVFDMAADRSARSICLHYEDTVARKQGVDQTNVLCRLSLDGDASLEPVSGKLAEQDGPMLLFLHGTASSTRGSFGALWREGAGGLDRRLRECYGQRMFSFEHRSLTDSPVRNALDLVKQLPDGAVLHIVSHSRGGLIGELLCRGERVRDGESAVQPFSEAEVEQYEKRLAESTGDKGDTPVAQHGAELRELSDLLAKRRLKIERFVRIACPVRGTTLASERFDLFLSALANIFGALPGPVAEIAGLFADMTRALVSRRTDPRVLPGLEAMMPSSALVWLVNHQEARVRSDLAVVAGDIEGNGLLGRLAVFLTDLFFRGQHDLVVDTDFMVGGARRVGDSWRFFTQGVGVTHFGYFSEGAARTAVINALDRSGSAPRDFEVYDIDADNSRRRGGAAVRDRQRLTAATLPQDSGDVVFLLPGIMGSHLKAGGERTWLNYSRLIRGGMERLRLDATGIAIDGVIDDYYAELALDLGGTMQVIEWAYDWRKSLADTASELAADVALALTRIHKGASIRFVGHSMGGLVIRALALDHDDLWQAVRKRPGWRFLMLGTPNHGAWSTVQTLIGRDAQVAQLAFFDVKHSATELMRIIGGYPGLLDLLPHEAAVFKPETWRAWQQRDRDYLFGRVIWAVPEPSELARASAYASRLDAQWAAWAAEGETLKQRLGYVAGSAALTPSGVSSTGPLEAVGLPDGDGRVLWNQGFRPGDLAWLGQYFVPAVHGDLAAHRAAFAGIREWLHQGVTQALDSARPQSRTLTEPLPLLITPRNVRGEADFAALALGGADRSDRRSLDQAPSVRLASVVHADLREAHYDLLTGHYRGIDVLLDAERDLDELMEGALKQALDLRQFPGDLNRSRLFVRPGSWRANPVERFGADAPDGRTGLGAVGGASGPAEKPLLSHAIVTGLGVPGELTPPLLRETVLNALLSYALRQLELAAVLGSNKAGRRMQLGISSTLIGTSSSMISIEDAVLSILRAADDANRRLKEAGHPISIVTVQFVELWQDQAIEAARALQRISDSGQLSPALRVEDVLLEGEGGLVREGIFRDSDWWSRLRIASTATETGRAGQRPYGGLKFTLQTDRARLESRMLETQRRQIDQFVAEAVGGRDVPAGVAETLYQLLLPNELKGHALMGRRLALLVDEDSAGYPWELLKSDGEASVSAPALAGGIVRQLDLENFRERGDLVTNGNALVVGDPLLAEPGQTGGFGQLPGARAEAEIVSKQLGRQDFRVRPMINARGPDIMRVLMSERFQILHLAGHGQYQAEGSDGMTVTGMMLGNGWYLTANEIGQMQGIPELVFVNCCHLGRTDGSDVGSSLREPHRFAASLATALMKGGVRCVIAAGWAIDDDAARVFAECFYAAFAGPDREPFGNAVRKARRRCYELRPQSNTWAAFQCYGDPAFRLSMQGGKEGPQASSRPARGHVAAAEVISHLANLSVGLYQQDLDRALERIKEIEASIKPEWRLRGDVLAALGDAYRRARSFDDAIRCYDGAREAPGGSAGLNVLERQADLVFLADIEKHLTDVEAHLTKARRELAHPNKAGKLIFKVLPEWPIDTLEKLVELAPSPVRQVLLAWALKRAVIESENFMARRSHVDEIHSTCGTALARLEIMDLGARSDSKLNRLKRAAEMMQSTVSLVPLLPGAAKVPSVVEQRAAALERVIRLRAGFGADSSGWDEVFRLGLDWAIEMANEGPTTEAKILLDLKAIEPTLSRLKDRPRLWSIAREQWWFCQILRLMPPDDPDGSLVRRRGSAEREDGVNKAAAQAVASLAEAATETRSGSNPEKAAGTKKREARGERAGKGRSTQAGSNPHRGGNGSYQANGEKPVSGVAASSGTDRHSGKSGTLRKSGHRSRVKAAKPPVKPLPASTTRRSKSATTRRPGP